VSAVALAKGDKGDDGWVLIDGQKQNMGGSIADLKAALALQKNGEPLLYVRRAGKAWVIRDPATLDKVRAAWAPTNTLGERMGALGKKMSVIGDQQSALGDKMRATGEKLAELGTQLGRRSLDDKERTRSEREIERLSAELEKMGAQMTLLSKQMQPFTEEMNVFQGEMNKAVARAEGAMTALVDDAIARKLAVEVK
jgi:chromosome segregation ATPase